MLSGVVRLLFDCSADRESLVAASRRAARAMQYIRNRLTLWTTARDTLIYLLFIYAAALVALRVFLRDVLRPLAAVEAAAQAIAARNFVTLRLRPSTRELARVVVAMNSLSRKVNEAIEAETRRAERLQDAAYRDQGTGLLNARGFAARFESSYEGEREPFAGVFAFVELGNWRQSTASWAPSVATRCARCAWDAGGRGDLGRLRRALVGRPHRARAAWAGHRRRAARPDLAAQGGARGDEAARARAQRQGFLRRRGGTRRAVAAAPPGGGGRCRADAGAREYRRHRRAARRTAGDADGETGFRDAHAWSPMRSPRNASTAGQGAYRLSDHRPLHTEIMARLRDASGRELGAAEFLPAVAAQGLGEQLDRVVIEQVLEAARGREGTIAINVSVRSVEQESFMQWLLPLLQRERPLAVRLVFEMAENAVMQNEAAAFAFARSLANTGAGFALDNFGIRRDSLALVQRLRPAYIKLAGAHTRTMLTNSGARFYAESLIAAARQLDIPVIAQNVEDEAMFQAIAGLGFAGYQGPRRQAFALAGEGVRFWV